MGCGDSLKKAHFSYPVASVPQIWKSGAMFPPTFGPNPPFLVSSTLSPFGLFLTLLTLGELSFVKALKLK